MAFYDSDSDSDGDSAFDDPNQAMALAVAHWRARGAADRRSRSQRSAKGSFPASVSAGSAQAPTNGRGSPTQSQSPARSRLAACVDVQLSEAHFTPLPLPPLLMSQTCTLQPSCETMKSLPPLPVEKRENAGHDQQHQPLHTIRPVASSSELLQRLRHFRSMLSFSGERHAATTPTTLFPPSVPQERSLIHRASAWSLFTMKRAGTTNTSKLKKEPFPMTPNLPRQSHAAEESSSNRDDVRLGVFFGAESGAAYRTISQTTVSPQASASSRRTTITGSTIVSTISHVTSGMRTPVLEPQSPAASHHPRTTPLRDTKARLGEERRRASREFRRLSDNFFGTLKPTRSELSALPPPPPPGSLPCITEDSPRVHTSRRRRSFDLWINSNRARSGGIMHSAAKTLDLERLMSSAGGSLEDNATPAIEFWPQPIPPAGVPISAAVATRSPLVVSPIASEYYASPPDSYDELRTALTVARNSLPPTFSNIPSVYAVAGRKFGKDLA
ncbi:hypothetical protein HDU83_004108 [Entophlyctis luteolus]|nr:hypothetical protein HDU83_004108 [Entophlyctis luteolus]